METKNNKLKKAISIMYSAFIVIDFMKSISTGKYERSNMQYICDSILSELNKKTPDMELVKDKMNEIQSELQLLQELNKTT
jgi:ribulose kinase